MKDQTKTKQALIQELSSLKHRIQELERAESERKRVEEALHESETKLQAIFDTVGTGIIIIDRDTQIIIEANQTAVEMTGLPKERIIGQICHSLVCPAQAGKCPVKDLGQSVDNSERKLIHADGHLKDILKTVYPVTIRGRGCYLESFIDITDRKQAEEALRESEKKYRNILESIQEGYFELDLAGNFTFVNDAECRNLEYSRDELIGMNNRQYQDETTAQKMNQLFRRLYRTGEPVKALDVEIIRKTGTKGFNEVSISLIRDAESKPIGFRGISRDITERKRAEDALRESEKRYHELSIVDDLTQLYNSRHFYFQLKSELDRSNRYEQPLTLLLLDLDNFKAFNDAYGHVEGDQVLRQLGQVVKRCLRETDFACRYGGEEFTIILPMTTSADGAVTAERIRAEFKKENFSPDPGKDVNMMVSIGVAQYRTREDMKAFVHRVDQLMYQGKTNGKDRVCSES